MDWLNELPPATGIDKVVGEMAKRLLEGPVVFRSQYWDGDIRIETLTVYCAWARFGDRMDNERGAEGRAFEIWEEEKKRKPVDDEILKKKSVKK
jgi:hypothetical protein